MAERLRTEGVGRGVNWNFMANMANIESDRGDYLAKSLADIGSGIVKSVEEARRFKSEREARQIDSAAEIYRATKDSDPDTADRAREFMHQTLLKNFAPNLSSMSLSPDENGIFGISSGNALGDLSKQPSVDPEVQQMADYFSGIVETSAAQKGMSSYDWIEKDASKWRDSLSSRVEETNELISRLMARKRRTDTDNSKLSELRFRLRRDQLNATKANSVYSDIRQRTATAKSANELRQFDSVLRDAGFGDELNMVASGLRKAVEGGSLTAPDALKILNQERQQRRLSVESESRLAAARARIPTPETESMKLYDRAYRELMRRLSPDNNPNYAGADAEDREKILRETIADMKLDDRRLLAVWPQAPGHIRNAAYQAAIQGTRQGDPYGEEYEINGQRGGLYLGRDYAREMIDSNRMAYGLKPIDINSGIDYEKYDFQSVDGEYAKDADGTIVLTEEDMNFGEQTPIVVTEEELLNNE